MNSAKTNSLETLDKNFPILMKLGGFFGACVATVAALKGVQFGAPLLGLFGSMMAGGQLADAIRHGKQNDGKDTSGT